MKEKKGRKGSVTVFLSLMLVVILLLSCALTDAVRIYSFEQQNARAMEAAAKSVLAGYNETLAADYGIYAVDTQSTANTISSEFMKYYTINLGNEDSEKTHLKGAQISGFGSAVSAGEIQSDLVAYMKYRAPAYLAEELVGKIMASGTVTEASGLTEKIQSVAGSIDKLNINADIAEVVTDLVKIGVSLSEIFRIKAEIGISDLTVPKELLIGSVERENANTREKDVFDTMSAQPATLPGLAEAAGWTEKINKGLIACRDNVFLLSYIMEKFNSWTNDPSETAGARFMRQGEIEYILFGDLSKSANVNKVMNAIYLSRFLIDSCDAFAKYSEFEPTERTILALVAGALSGLEDTIALYKGEEIGLAPELSSVKIDYNDHLMLLLLAGLAADKEAILNRVADVVQLNLSTVDPKMRLSNMNTGILCETEVSIDLLFFKYAGKREYVSKKRLYKTYQ